MKSKLVCLLACATCVAGAQTSTTFTAPLAYAMGTTTNAPPAIVTGDFNGDGKPDILTVGDNGLIYQVTIGVALGKGDGTFLPPVVTLVGAPGNGLAAPALTAGDFNSDGKLDVLVGNQVFLGDGTGKFQPGTSLPFTGDAVAADFNGDGRLDVAVENGTKEVQLYLGNGDGTFRAPLSIAVKSIAVGAQVFFAGLSATDLNHDGKLDLVAVYNVFPPDNYYAEAIPLVNNGNGTFREGAGLKVSTNNLVIGDVNHDGIPDLVDAVDNFPQSTFSSVGVFVGNGDGTFQAPVPYQTPLIQQNANLLYLADMQGSGFPDLFITSSPLGPFFRLPNLGNGTFGTGHGAVSGPSFALAFADFNGDGKLDIATANSDDDETGTVLLGTGAGGFVQPAANADAGTLSLVEAFGFVQPQVAFADFNHDGITDTFLASGVLLLGTDTNGVGFAPPVKVGPAGLVVVSGDFNGDGNPDIAITPDPGIGASPSDEILVLAGKGDGTFGTPVAYGLHGSAVSAALADVNHDGHPDLLVTIQAASSYEYFLSVLLGTADGTFSTATDYPLGPDVLIQDPGDYGGVAVGDFNRDGNPDAAVTVANGTAILFGTGKGAFGAPAFVPLPKVLAAQALGSTVLAADITGDGKPDLVLGYNYYEDPHTGAILYAGNGDGTFRAPVALDLVAQPSSLAFADVNGDGIPDLLGCGKNGDIGIALGAGNGLYQRAQRYLTGLSCEGIYGGTINPRVGLGIATFNGPPLVEPPDNGSTVAVVLPKAAALTAAQVTARFSGLAYSRLTKTFNGTVTVTNVGKTVLSGPFHIVVNALPAGVTLLNASGTASGSPYLSVAGRNLAPGQTVTVAVEFSNPQDLLFQAQTAVYAGSLP